MFAQGDDCQRQHRHEDDSHHVNIPMFEYSESHEIIVERRCQPVCTPECIQRECAPNERQYQSCRHTNKNGKQSHPSLEEQLRQGHSHYRDDARQPVGADGIGGGEKHVDANDHNQRRCQRRGKESDDLLPRHHPEQLAHQQINNADKQ